MNSSTFPNLTTKRLQLRRLTEQDIPQIVKYANNPKISEMTLNIPHPYREKDARWWIETADKGFENKDHFIFAICKLNEHKFIGGIGLDLQGDHNRAELGFWLGEPFWNQGYMTEAVKKVLTFGFERLNLNKIQATHFLNNPASGRVMAKSGMVKKGELKEHIQKGDAYRSVIQYRLTKREFLGQHE